MIVQCPDCTTRYQLDSERVPAERIRVRCPKCRYVFSIDGRLAGEGSAAGQIDSGPASAGFEAPDTPAAPAHASPGAGFGDIRLSGPTPPASGARPPMGASSSSGPASRATVPVVEAPSAVATEEPVAPPDPVPQAAPAEEFDLEIDHGHMPASPARTAAPEASEPPEAPPRAAARVEAPQPASRSATAANPADDKARRLARALVSDILVYNRDARDQALAQGNLVQALGQEIKKSWELYKEKVTPEVANSTNHFRDALNEILADGQKIF